MTRRAVAPVLAPLLALGLTLSACGDDTEPTADDAASDDVEGMDGMVMNEPDATPADELDGAASGDFVLLDTAPPGSEGVTGEAFLAQDEDGTTVTIRLSGLEPETAYLSHLHDQVCTADNAGEHFKFDPDGSDVPPNEVHLGFTTDADGTGEATVTNEMQVEDGAPSVVVHPADAMDNRLACADFA